MAFRAYGGVTQCILASAFLVVACKSNGSSSERNPSALAEAAAAPDVSGDRPAQPPRLPPEPAPPLAHLAHEVPQLEVRLAADTTYAAVWDGGREDINVFLTILSETMVEGAVGEEFARDPKLVDAAIPLLMIWARNGRFPDAFGASFQRYFQRVSEDVNRGLWAPASGVSAGFDFTALAVWFYPTSALVLRERIAAKDQGPSRWPTHAKANPRPYLVDEREALDRLAILSDLTSEEAQRKAAAALPRIGDAFELGALRYQVTSAEARVSIGAGYAQVDAPRDASFYVVSYTVEVAGSRTVRVLTDTFVLVDSQGREFLPSSKANVALAMDGSREDLVSMEIQPGLPLKTATAFEVPTGALIGRLVLVVDESGIGRGERAAVALATH